MSLSSPLHIIRRLLGGTFSRLATPLERSSYGAYSGVFNDFESARASLPTNPGFDHEALAAEYVDIRTKKVFAYDYPVMWWLEHAFLGGASSVLDIGGSVGVHYYAYRRYFDMPADLEWRVVEVPAMIAVGRSLAEKHGATALSFVEDLNRAVATIASDLWISAGAVQYIEDGRPDSLLKRCVVRPRHVLLNKLPLYGGVDFVTTQNIGEGSFAPLHVYNRARFIRDMRLLGYTLRDQWPVYERSLHLPGHPERSFPSFTGLYFVDSESSEPPSE